MNSKKHYDEAVDLLKEAYDGLITGTNNQQAMPDHLMRVAHLFGKAKDHIASLEKEALKQSKRWSKNLYGYGSSSNNNNNNKTKKRKHNT